MTAEYRCDRGGRHREDDTEHVHLVDVVQGFSSVKPCLGWLMKVFLPLIYRVFLQLLLLLMPECDFFGGKIFPIGHVCLPEGQRDRK